jgi:Amidase
MLAYMMRQSLMRAWARVPARAPAYPRPIYTGIPVEAAKGYSPAEAAEIVHGLRMTTAINGLGLPAVALPVGVSDGLPQAVQLIGPRFREDLCLDAAAALEDRVGIITPIDPRPGWMSDVGPGAAEGLSSRFARLSALDLMFLRVESKAWPCHFGVSPCWAAAPSLNHPAAPIGRDRRSPEPPAGNGAAAQATGTVPWAFAREAAVGRWRRLRPPTARPCLRT